MDHWWYIKSRNTCWSSLRQIDILTVALISALYLQRAIVSIVDFVHPYRCPLFYLFSIATIPTPGTQYISVCRYKLYMQLQPTCMLMMYCVFNFLP